MDTYLSKKKKEDTRMFWGDFEIWKIKKVVIYLKPFVMVIIHVSNIN